MKFEPPIFTSLHIDFYIKVNVWKSNPFWQINTVMDNFNGQRNFPGGKFGNRYSLWQEIVSFSLKIQHFTPMKQCTNEHSNIFEHRRSWGIFYGGHFFSFLVEISTAFGTNSHWDKIKCYTSWLLGMFHEDNKQGHAFIWKW